MQKKRPRSQGSTRDGSGATPPAPVATKRTVRVRSRLVAGVAVVGVIVLAAGAPAALSASSDLAESQRLVTLSELNQRAVTLAHSLADERDAVTAYIAGGRADDGQAGAQSRLTRTTRVDQQIDEIHEPAPAALRRDLSTVPSLRRDALTGKGSALEAHQAYSEVIAKLHGIAAELADKTPPRAADATRAPLALGGAVEQASATRGLLLAALAVPAPEPTTPQIDPFTGLPVEGQDDATKRADRDRDELSAAAQQARVRELASLAEFDQAANPVARDKLSATVTGPEVNSAEKYLARLTDRPELSESERTTNAKKLESALSARVDRMRGVESALATTQVQRLEGFRDDDVTALELSIALLGGCFLLAVGVSTAVARTLTQPLAVLRIGAARLADEPATAEPVRYTGRNDEFAQVVRSMNTLHAKLTGLQQEFTGRFENLNAERAELIAGREALTLQRAELQVQAAELATQLERLKNTVHHTFVNLSLRNLGLVERQLGVIESLEEREQDPERLATLFKLDHMATVMRRHSENMLVLAGAEHGHGHAGPIPLVDVARAAVSEIERYERVTIQSLPPHAQIAGFAADDLSHLLAELLENATSFSPPDSHVELSGWLLETGEVMLSVQDEGIGMSSVRMSELNARLADPASFEAGEQNADGAGLGLQVTSLLAARHGVRVQLREQKGSGVTAVVVLPQTLLPNTLPASSPPAVQLPGEAPTLNLPGSVAEANSNALPSRTPILPPVTAEPTPPASGAPAEGASGAASAQTPGATSEPEPAVEPEPASAAEPIAEPAAEPAVDPMIAAAERAIHEAGTQEQAPAGGAETPEDPEATAVPQQRPEADAPAESDSEVTMQVRLPMPPADPAPPTAPASPAVTPETPQPSDPYAIGPDRHERPAESTPGGQEPDGPEFRPTPRAEAAADTVPGPRRPQAERVTDKGLPKRTPKVVRPEGAPTTGRTGSLDKDDLRRRLGSFHQAAKEGRRDVEAEIAESTGSVALADHEGVATGRTGHETTTAPVTGTAHDTGTTEQTGGRTDRRNGETGDTVEEARS
ncbi:MULTISPECIES: sensor histidine kinase [unclassified Streptomyces]|uniref:sensor histidine kinase n=1 Tax=unclassified Streptomyces TaxID=2593676 RepID=UPI000978D83E|nr:MULTISPECIES: nitrate- and nitrite sensing domain-containing protein [unclassified Streptomyces]ONI55674.1 Sensor histidine kinase YycG [Streptomyces sp. IB2014 011-1]RDV53388.1 HAMP domain-containing protein [Streptomyces sp. IB2014 011-12]CAD5945833.1 HAMP domain-containing protein [Streptomyces sp. KY70]CAD5986423.1 HAMP domain-containing protein [Streptomyces sp. KY75]